MDIDAVEFRKRALELSVDQAELIVQRTQEGMEADEQWILQFRPMVARKRAVVASIPLRGVRPRPQSLLLTLRLHPNPSS